MPGIYSVRRPVTNAVGCPREDGQPCSRVKLELPRRVHLHMHPPVLQCGPKLRAGPFHIRRIDYPPGWSQSPHSHGSVGMTVVLTGDIRESTRFGEATGSALSVVVKPAGVRHADVVGPRGARTLQVAFAPDGAGRLSDHAGLEHWRWIDAGPASAQLLSLARVVRQALTTGGKGTRPEELEDRVLDAIATISPVAPTGSSTPDWLLRVKEELDDRIGSGIGVAELARRVGAHPVTVSRGFRVHYGITFTEYRRRERVRRAAARIGVSSSSLSRIAHSTGHADHPHFCREFRRVTGLTPSEYRRLIAPA